MLRWIPTLTLTLVAALLAGPATASAAKQTYCQKKLSQQRGKPKVDKRVGGVTVYHSGSTYSACSDQLRKDYALTIVDPGQRVAKVVVARKRCVAILFSGGKSEPEILFRDLGAKATTSAVRTVGFGTPGAQVGALAMASNCSVAWSEIIGDSVTVYGRGFPPFSAIPDNQSVQVGTAGSAAEAKTVTITAAGKGATISWINAGVKQTKSLP